MEREFDLGDILTVTTGRLVSPRRMEGVHDILEYMAGGPVWTHQIGRVCKEAAPALLAQHPALAGVVVPDSFESDTAVLAWVARQKARLGDALPVSPMTVAEHHRIDPISELVEMVHPSRILVAKVSR